MIPDYSQLSTKQLLNQLDKCPHRQAARHLLSLLSTAEIRTYLSATARSPHHIKQEPIIFDSSSIIRELLKRNRAVDIIQILDNLEVDEIEHKISERHALKEGGNQSSETSKFRVGIRSKNQVPAQESTSRCSNSAVAELQNSFIDDQELEVSSESSSSDESESRDSKSSEKFPTKKLKECGLQQMAKNHLRLNVKSMTLTQLSLHCVNNKIISNKERVKYLSLGREGRAEKIHSQLGRLLARQKPDIYYIASGMPQVYRKNTSRKLQRAYQGKDPDYQSQGEVEVISKRKFYSEGGQVSSSRKQKSKKVTKKQKKQEQTTSRGRRFRPRYEEEDSEDSSQEQE